MSPAMQNTIKTQLTDLFGLRYPIICAPMFLISNPDMLVAAAQAGIMGAMPSLNYRSTEEFAAALTEIRARTQGAFAVNLIVLHNDRLQADLAVCIQHRVPLIITSLGNPGAVIEQVHAYGGKVFCDVVNLKHALKVKEAGADGLIAVSQGAGGHAGAIVSNVLVPYLIEQTGLPVLAAGGMSTGRQLHAALALGAIGGYVGTRFIASTESPAPEAYKEMLIKSGPEEIVLSDQVTGHSANFLKSSLEQYQSNAEGLARWRDVWSAGQGVALIQDTAPMAVLVERMAVEYWKSLNQLQNG